MVPPEMRWVKIWLTAYAYPDGVKTTVLSLDSSSRYLATDFTLEMIDLCVSTTPLDFPVLPDVWIISASP